MRPYVAENLFMKYDPDKHHRRAIRMPHYDYSSVGLYALTICASKRGDIFGRVVDAETVRYHRFGEIVIEEWLSSFELRAEMELDCWQLMPDHLHAIVCITEQLKPAVPRGNVGVAYRMPRSVSTFVSGFKGAVTRSISAEREQPTKVWQERFWDRVIRDERELANQRQYILDNPGRWLERHAQP